MLGTIMLLAAATLAVNFDEEVGRVRPELHSSGFCATICSCSEQNVVGVLADAKVKAEIHDYTRDCWRWSWSDGFAEAAKAEGAGSAAVVPLWGDRIL